MYRRRDRIGRLYALELVSGDTLKPLIEEHGRTPLPPDPAYQQFLYGVPAGWYTTDELDYLRETARTESVYGVSRVERIILRINQALRKQDFDLARFTDGTTPLGNISPPEGLPWTPEQLRTFEQTFNGLLAGNDQMRVRARALPPGSTWQALAGDGWAWELAEFYQRRAGLDEVIIPAVVELSRKHGVAVWYCDAEDPEATARLSAALAREGLQTRALAVQKGPGSVRAGIQTVTSLLSKRGDGTRGLYVDPCCRNTIAEFGTYAYATVAEGQTSRASRRDPKEEPLKQSDHALDSARYALHSELAGTAKTEAYLADMRRWVDGVQRP